MRSPYLEGLRTRLDLISRQNLILFHNFYLFIVLTGAIHKLFGLLVIETVILFLYLAYYFLKRRKPLSLFRLLYVLSTCHLAELAIRVFCLRKIKCLKFLFFCDRIFDPMVRVRVLKPR